MAILLNFTLTSLKNKSKPRFFSTNFIFDPVLPHRIHVWRIYLHFGLDVWQMYVNIPYMDPMGTAVFHHFPRLPGWLSPTKGNRRRFSSKTRKGHEYSTSTFCNEWTERAAFQKQTKQRNLSRIQSGDFEGLPPNMKKTLLMLFFPVTIHSSF